MNKFKQIQRDEEIVEIYDKISRFEDLDKGWAYHNLDHVNNVAYLVESLLRKSFSKKMNLKPIVLFNNYKWDVFDKILID